MNQNTINLGILAHVDAGKTTVSEGLLYHSGAVKRMGNVDRGTTVTDSMPLEQQRGMTIRASTVSFSWNGKKVNLIDTPGHLDFFAEVERSLSALDGVILVISAKEGVQPQTRAIFRKLRERRIPTLFFLNKIDRLGVDLDAVYGEIRAQLTEHTLRMQEVGDALSLRQRTFEEEPFLEELAGESDRLLRRYLDDGTASEEFCARELQSLTRQGKLFPLFQGSALRDVGLAELLDAVTLYFGHPADPDAPLSAYVYKLEWTEGHKKRMYVRVFAGRLAVRKKALLVRTGESFLVRNLLAVENGAFHSASCIEAGDIGVLLDVSEPKCGDFLGLEFHRRPCRETAEPLLSAAVHPRCAGERQDLLEALRELEEEDPFLSLHLDEATGEIALRFFGKLQMEVVETLLRQRYGLCAELEQPSTRYKERPAGRGLGSIRIGGNNHLHAGVVLSVEPLPPGSGVLYETKVSYGALEKPFQNAVAEGVRRGLACGLGYEVTDSKVCFLEADYDSVMGTPADFRALTPAVVRLALQSSGTERMEPWLCYQASVPADMGKRILSELQKIRAVIEEITYGEANLRLTGKIPFETSREFAADLLAYTEGKGSFETTFDRYLPLKRI